MAEPEICAKLGSKAMSPGISEVNNGDDVGVGGGRPFSEETAPSYQLIPVFLGHFSTGARQGQVAVYQRACGFEVTQ